MTTVNRESLLTKLETLQPGLTAQDVVEQSSCFVFTKKRIVTYNEEIACSQPNDTGIRGAVRAAPLLAILRKLSEEELEVEASEGELLVKGAKRRNAGIHMEAEILLPTGSVDVPTDGEAWKELPQDFLEGIAIVQSCAGKDASQFVSTCIHVHPKWLEACDNYQAVRFRVATGFEQPILARRDSLKHIVPLGMTEFAETEAWLHFRNSDGLVLSCRRNLEDYPNLKPFLAFEGGSPLTLPKGLAAAADKALVFAGENKDHTEVLVQLKSGKLRIRGEGASGWYSEVTPVVYDGPPLNFVIDPKLLSEIAQRHPDCVVTKDRLKVDGGKFVYISSLGDPDEKDTEAEDKADRSE